MGSAPRVHDCPLCGHHFEEPSCGPCPMKAACHAVRCPRCGYECWSPSGPLGALRGMACELRSWLARSTARS